MKNLFWALSTQDGLSFWEDLWKTFYEDHILNDTYYEHLDMGSGAIVSLKTIVIGLCVGLAVASFGAFFNKKILGGFVRKLLADSCLSADASKSLEELGYGKNIFIRYGVKRSVSLRRVVRCKEEEEYEAALQQDIEDNEKKRENDRSVKKIKFSPFKINCDEHHFYIPEDMKYVADVKFDEKGASLLGSVIFLLVMAIVMIAIFFALPYILDLVNDWVGAVKNTFSPSDNILS